MLSDAVRFPFRRDGWAKTLLVGSALSVLGVLIVPALAVFGYSLRVVHSGSERGELPVFDEWGGLVLDGLRLAVVVAVYASVGLLVGFVVSLVIALATRAVAGGVVFPAVVTTLTWVTGTVAFVAALYLLPAAAANLARENSLRAAFDPGVVAVAARLDYLVAVLLAVVVSAVLGTIAGLLTIVLVGVVLAFYTQVVTAYLLGRGVGGALTTTGTPSTR